MYELPTSVTVDGREYTITNNGDFRMVLDCIEALRDDEMSEDFRVLASLLIFYNEFDSVDDILRLDAPEKLVEEMYKFINLGKLDTIKNKQDYMLIDWESDSQMICSGINNVIHKEIRAIEYVHWWTFIGYYMAIGESTLATVVNIRNKMCKHKKLEKWERDFKRENPEYFNWKSQTVEAREADRIIREIWNSNKGE